MPALERLGRWCRRHPTVAALATAIVLLLASGAAGGWWVAARLGQQVEAVTAAERAMTQRLWESRLAQAQAGRASRLPGQRFKSLEAIAEAARIRPTCELRNEAIACLALADVRIEREWDADLETDRLEFSTGVAFDPTLEHYASTKADGTVSIRAVSDDRLVARFPGNGERAEFLHFSPDGRYLAVRSFNVKRGCYVWDWREGRTVFARPRMVHYPASLDFRPDSRSFVLGDKKELVTVELPSGQIIGVVQLDVSPGWLAVAPGPRYLVAVCGMGPGKLRVVEPSSGRTIASWNDLPAELVAVAWHPGGARLAASGTDGSLYIFDLTSRTPTTILRGHLLEARELAFSPDGALLVSRAWDGTTRFWDPIAGHELLRIRNFSFLQFDRAGRRLAYRGYKAPKGGWVSGSSRISRSAGCCTVAASLPKGMQVSLSVPIADCWPRAQVKTSVCGIRLRGACWGSSRPASRRTCSSIRLGILFYTAGSKGTLSCGLTRAPNEEGVCWKIERPMPLLGSLPKLDGFQLSTDADGGRLAVVVRFGHVLVLPMPGRPGLPVDLRFHPQVSAAALSPDGRYVATGTSRGRGVKVWDTDTGRLAHDLPAKGSAGVVFTPDGLRLLVMESGEGSLSWLSGRNLGTGVGTQRRGCRLHAQLARRFRPFRPHHGPGQRSREPALG